MSSSTTRSQPRSSEPIVLVVFGASGDLTRRKLLPAIFQLWCQNLLPHNSSIIGFARREKTDESFRDELRAATRDSLNCQGQSVSADEWASFAPRLFYHRGAYDDPSAFAGLKKRIEQLSAETGTVGHCVYYLATPPSAFEPIVEQLGVAGLARRGQESPWGRIVVEKPFGRDLDTARWLNAALLTVFDEEQIFRIDHYLGKETVQNIMVLRFANSIFEHIWSHDYVDHVQITVAESIGVGVRGGYYDQAGALRDMLQNHMMHLLSLVAMEPPIALTADAIRGEKVKVLRALRPIGPDCATNGVVRAQYTAGRAGDVDVPGYRQADGVAADSPTETFIALAAHVDNWRWAGVPFYLRTGKCLPRRCTEISVHFNPVPKILFNRSPAAPLAANVLTIRVQPDEGIALEFQVKSPGSAMDIRPLQMNFAYAESFGSATPDAYERLLLDVAVGDATLFTRSDEVDAAWEFVAPVLESCSQCQSRCKRLVEYPAGTWGPNETGDLIGADGRSWHLK